jgi:hypothetical protein
MKKVKKVKKYDDADWFVVSWCCEGLEGIIPVTELERQATFDILSGNEPNPKRVNQSINMMVLRARFNTQRHYEIYAISATPGIAADDIRSMFEDDPQYAADLIRERGTKIHSDRVNPTKVVIS